MRLGSECIEHEMPLRVPSTWCAFEWRNQGVIRRGRRLRVLVLVQMHRRSMSQIRLVRCQSTGKAVDVASRSSTTSFTPWQPGNLSTE